jgi:hypothetical protein
MRTILAMVALSCPAIAVTQVASSLNQGCTVVAPSGMSCDGIGAGDAMKDGEKDHPKLIVTDMKLAPGAFFEDPNDHSDCLVLGISGGDLLNEKTPFRHVSLEKNSVSLMPEGMPFRLRNNGSESVEFRLIEIRR